MKRLDLGIKQILLVVAALGLAASCSVSTDIGKPCALVKASGDGGETNVTVADLQGNEGNEDIITFGNPACTSLTCVLDAENVLGAVNSATANSGPIFGYCSKPCSQSISGDCSQQYGDLQNTDGGQIICRSLVLDQQAIDTICSPPTGSAAQCQQVFGNSSAFAPLFCARGPDVAATPDAGP